MFLSHRTQSPPLPKPYKWHRDKCLYPAVGREGSPVSAGLDEHVASPKFLGVWQQKGRQEVGLETDVSMVTVSLHSDVIHLTLRTGSCKGGRVKAKRLQSDAPPLRVLPGLSFLWDFP